MPLLQESEAERKQLTVLFADVSGSMDLQEDVDPEVWAGMMGRLVEILAQGVRRFGGTVDKFTGDGIMALFGAPVAQEDHAQRACHAASALIGAIAGFTEEMRTSHGLELQVRLGLNSGEVVVGRVGDDVRLDPTALGHTVGLAQRMEALAQPGHAYLTEHTARLVETAFRLRTLGPMIVKGAREPVGVFVLEGPRTRAPDDQRGRPGDTSPLVGRDWELAILEKALSAAESGRAQVVGVVGEAGVGKSRLCEEFARGAARRGFTVRRTTGVSHGRDLPLLPVLSLLRDYFSVGDEDGPEQAREKVTRYLLDLDPALDEVLPVLFDLLEIPDPQRPAPRLAPDVRMQRIFEALRRVTACRSEQEVLVLLVEDLHWFDPQSEGFLERLVEAYPGSRTLVVTNCRPEFSAPWMRHSYYRQLPLAPLTDQAVGQLVDALTGTDPSLGPLAAFVSERTGGNPFFVEEVVRTLVEDRTLDGAPGSYRLVGPLQDVRVPPSVQAVLAARIDRLDPNHKAVLQAAAAIGRTFPRPVLAAVAGMGETSLGQALRALCAAELLQQTGRQPGYEYRFWHPLTQEVAYQSMLRPARARLHGAVARAIVDLEPERLDELAALVALHFESAGEAYEAASWNVRAAGRASRLDVHEALRRLQASLALLQKLPDTVENLKLEVTVRTRLVQYEWRAGADPDELDAHLSTAKAIAQRLGDHELLALLAEMHGVLCLSAGRMADAVRLVDEAALLATGVENNGLRAAVWMDQPIVYAYAGGLPDALDIAERVAAVVGDDHGLGAAYWGYSPRHSIMRSRAEILALTGRIGEARSEADRLLAQARRQPSYEMTSWVLFLYPRFADLAGESEDTRAIVEEAVNLTRDAGNWPWHVMALASLGLAELLAGRWAEAVAVLGRGREISHRHGVHLEDARLLAYLARAHLQGNDLPAARQAADEAVAVAFRQEARVLACQTLLIRAQLFRQLENHGDQAASDIDSGLDLVRETGALTYEPFLREELGRLRPDRTELIAAFRLYSAIGAGGHARRLEAELAGTKPG